MTPSLSVYMDGYSDGKPFRLLVSEVECGHLMAANRVHQVQEAIRAGRDSGLTISISSAFRTMEEQQALWEGWKKREPGFNPADTPGHSKHQDGTAIDLAFGSGNEREDFAAIALAHGLTRPVVREPWHFVAGETPEPIPDSDEAETLT